MKFGQGDDIAKNDQGFRRPNLDGLKIDRDGAAGLLTSKPAMYGLPPFDDLLPEMEAAKAKHEKFLDRVRVGLSQSPYKNR